MSKVNRNEFFKTLAAALFYFGIVIGGIKLFTSGDPKALVESAGVWAPIAFIFLKASTIIVAPLGGNPIYLMSTALFGYENAFMYLFIGDCIGYFGAFFVGRYFGRSLMNILLSEKQRMWLENILSQIGTLKGFFIARIVFLPYSDVLSYAAGLTPLSLKAYSLATIPFIIAYIILFLTLGGTLVTSGKRFVTVILVLVVAPILYVGIQRMVQQMRKQKSTP